MTLLLLTRWIPPVQQPLVLLMLGAGLLIPPGLALAGPLQEGRDAYQRQAYDQALKQFLDGQLQDPDNPSVLYNIGNTYYKMEDFEAAKAHYLQALTKAPPELKPNLLYNLGNSAFRQGALEEAAQKYEAALKLNPDDRQARENLAYVKQQMQKQQQKDQQDQSQNDASKKQDQNSDSQPSPQGSSSDKDQSPKPPEDDSRSREDSQQDNHRQEKEPASQAQKDQNQKTGQPDGEKTSSAASQMLNRLKDQPGKALMPNYKKRSVEKDW